MSWSISIGCRNGDGGRNRKGVAGEAEAEEEKGDDCDELHDWLLIIIITFVVVLLLLLIFDSNFVL
jgi:hypothetical protein